MPPISNVPKHPNETHNLLLLIVLQDPTLSLSTSLFETSILMAQQKPHLASKRGAGTSQYQRKGHGKMICRRTVNTKDSGKRSDTQQAPTGQAHAAPVGAWDPVLLMSAPPAPAHSAQRPQRPTTRSAQQGQHVVHRALGASSTQCPGCSVPPAHQCTSEWIPMHTSPTWSQAHS